MKSTIIRFTEPQIALVMRAHPDCNLDRLTELSFEFDQAGKIIDCIGTIKDGGNIDHDYAGSGLARLYERHAANSQLDKPAQQYCNFLTARGLPMRKRGYSTCMKPSVIVWDLETVPDLGGFAAANDLVGKSDVEVREAIGDKFPKHIYHSIVCIGALIAHWEPDHWAVDAIGAPHVGERTEKQLIAAFCDKIAELSPQLVTFNGNSFDLPVLRYRAMIHGVSAPGLSVRPYFNRYTEDAIDLCDALSSFSPQGKATLHEISRIMGLPGKPKGIDGGEVERYFHEGKIKEIADYCETRHSQHLPGVAAVRTISRHAEPGCVRSERAELKFRGFYKSEGKYELYNLTGKLNS